VSAPARVTAAGIAIGAASGWNIANVGAVADELAGAYGVALATVGLFTTALFVVHMAMQVPAGRLADRLGARSVCMAALAILALANGLLCLAPEPWLALVGRALAGFGTGLGFVGGSDYVRASGGSPAVQGLYGGASLASPGLALAVVPALEGPLGFRAPYLSALAVSLAVLALLALAPPSPPAPPQTGSLLRSGFFRDRRLLRFSAIHAGSFGLSLVVGNWVVTLLERQGHAHRDAALAGSLTLLLGLVTRVLGGVVLHRRPGRARAWVAGSLLAGGAATALIAAAPPFSVAVAAAAAVGLAAGIPFAPAFTGAALARRDSPGAAVGFVNAWAALTILVGTPLVGLTFDLPGDGRWGFVAVALAWALAALATPSRRDLTVAG
jgi:MFS family permease